jgi:hypothetical protein
LDVGGFKAFFDVVDISEKLEYKELEDEVLEYKDLKCDIDGVIVEILYGDKLGVGGFKTFDVVDEDEHLECKGLKDKKVEQEELKELEHEELEDKELEQEELKDDTDGVMVGMAGSGNLVVSKGGQVSGLKALLGVIDADLVDDLDRDLENDGFEDKELEFVVVIVVAVVVVIVVV